MIIIHELIIQYPVLNMPLYIPAREHSLCNNTRDDCMHMSRTVYGR